MAPETWTEIERKLDVDDATAIPDLTRVDAVAEVAAPVEHDLASLYFDTTGLRLARHGVTLRRRTGSADEGWHLKLPVADDSRTEVRQPLGGPGTVVPDLLLGPVRALVRDETPTPVARIETRRREHRLRAADGTVLAVVCDDRVRAEQLLEGGDVRTWREWEVELVAPAASEGLLDAVAELLVEAGARPSGHAAKLSRAVAGMVPPREERPRRKDLRRGDVGTLVRSHLERQLGRLLVQDRRLRAGESDAVHQMRIAARRLRSLLKTYGSVFEEPVAAVADDLRWLGRELSAARDHQVLRERFAELLASQPPELVLGPVAADLDAELGAEEARQTTRALEALDDGRYFRLLDALEGLVAESGRGPEAGEPAREVLPDLLRRDARRLRRAVATASDAAPGADRDDALHTVRKKAKRLRYAAESMSLVLGKRADRFARSVKRIQRALGEHQDAVLSREVLRDHGARTHVEGRNGFTYGRLHALEERRAEEAVRAYEDALGEVELTGVRRRFRSS